jgi:hypothetical protein
MTTAPTGTPEHLRLAALTPYFSIIVLECTSDDVGGGFMILQRFLRRAAGERGHAIGVRITAETIVGDSDTDSIEDIGSLGDLSIDQIYGLARERKHRPGWTVKDSALTDVTNELTIAMRRDRLVAIHTDSATKHRLQKWLDHTPRPPFRRLPPDILQGTFKGDARALWLRGVHRRRVTKADSKTITGPRLQDAMDPFDDATFAMSAVKIAFDPQVDGAVLRGKLGTAPRTSSIWLKSMTDFPTFTAAAVETLIWLDKALAQEKPPDNLIPELATEISDLTAVSGAYEVLVAEPDDVRGEPDSDDELVARAELLSEALLAVHGQPDSPKFTMDVGFHGCVSGSLSIKPVQASGGFELDVRYASEPTNEPVSRQIRDAIGNGDLISVYYTSGHTFTARNISRQNIATTPFRGFDFVDFADCDITTEKPPLKGDQVIHDAIGLSGDKSLFGWVVQHFSDGWLICDDGAGEIADFLHLSSKGLLSAIHVKGADSRSTGRGVAVGPYQVVTSQAVKNIRALSTEYLCDRLRRQRIEHPACWHLGTRVADRDEFIELLEARVTTDKAHVVIVQPHLCQAVYERARRDAEAGIPTVASQRLALLDNLLNATRRTVRGVWDDLIVIGSR